MSMSIFTRNLRRCAWALALSGAVAGSALAANTTADDATDNSSLRICAAANELPYSNSDQKGYENKIATVIAEAMGRKPEFVWSKKPAIYLVRDMLDTNACDVVIGLDTGDKRVLTTKPYFRAPYVFVQRADSKLDLKDWNSPDLVKADHIGFVPGTPAQIMMEQVGLFNTHFNYMHSLTDFQDRRNKYTRIDPKRMIGDVAGGKADVAIAFAPEVARIVKASGLKMTVIPDNAVLSDGEKVPQHFDQSVGVRKGDEKLLAEVQAALDKAQPKIEAILKEEGIPLLAEKS